jgi:hypothetical protein
VGYAGQGFLLEQIGATLSPIFATFEPPIELARNDGMGSSEKFMLYERVMINSHTNEVSLVHYGGAVVTFHPAGKARPRMGFHRLR